MSLFGPTQARYNVLGVVVSGSVAALLYVNTFPNPFIYDDVFYVERNPMIRSVPAALQSFVQPFSPFAPGLYRPVTILSEAMDFAVAGLDARTFHGTNLLLHALASALFFLFALQLLRSFFPAFIAAVLFAAHPVHTEAVTWVSGRSEVLAGLFTFLSALLFLRARKLTQAPVLLIGSGISYLLALGSKEIAAPLPLVLLLWELLNRSPRGNPLQKSQLWELLKPYLPFAIALLSYLVLRFVALSGFSVPLSQVRTGDLSFLERMWLILPVFAHYLRLMVLPTGLRIEYDWVEFSPLIVGASFLLIILLIGWSWMQRKREPLFLFGIGWFFLFLLPVSNIIPIGEIVAERFLYLPSAGFCLVFGVLSTVLMKRSRVKTTLVLLLIFVSSAWLTIQRNEEWREPQIFWEKTLALSPKAPHALQNLASIYLANGDLARAQVLLLSGLSEWPEEPMLHFIAAQVYTALGDRAKAEQSLREALRLAGEDDLEFTAFQRGSVLLQLGHFTEALSFLEQSALQNPYDAATENNLGIVWANLGDTEKALAHFERAIVLYESQRRRSLEDQRNYEGVQENIEVLKEAL